MCESGKVRSDVLRVLGIKRMFLSLCGVPLASLHYKLVRRMSNSVERALPPLDLTGFLSQVAERWRKWTRAEDNVPFERHVFRQLAPTQWETADKFIARLLNTARHCNFGEALNGNMRG